ncbi:hypothetical protein NC653_034674 [Populus alba x Populus x berolinensis]|uniref:Transcription initiation factor TFIID subunit 2 TPR repeats domain-containing protein n=1 Tax=Populus alba x Populus x berolinensis TaxID=444605 RepID=A0AAD6LN30_9ROSI|nr:hypothetical protein NC653_034674 [Populus alba x Populus x berolinensis]
MLHLKDIFISSLPHVGKSTRHHRLAIFLIVGKGLVVVREGINTPNAPYLRNTFCTTETVLGTSSGAENSGGASPPRATVTGGAWIHTPPRESPEKWVGLALFLLPFPSLQTQQEGVTTERGWRCWGRCCCRPFGGFVVDGDEEIVGGEAGGRREGRAKGDDVEVVLEREMLRGDGCVLEKEMRDRLREVTVRVAAGRENEMPGNQTQRLQGPREKKINQLERDEDVVAQAQAIAALKTLPQLSFSVTNAMNNFLNDTKAFWRVRIETAFALANTASEENDWAGLLHLVKFYKSRRFDAAIGLPKPNDFHDFPEYFVLEGMQAFWDKLYCHSVAISVLEVQVQTEFGDINAIFDDLTTMLKALVGLCVNMNR